jgi:hypothetical protein
MNLLDAHGLLAVRHDRSVLPCEVMLEAGDGERIDAWPAYATALACQSGWLDDADTEAELDDAIQQGRRLLESGIIDAADLDETVGRVIAEVMAWGEALELKREPACSDG